ncbi:MAG: hypothetical protein K2M36_00365, partial [Clostridia bacterium]|nr:hypothetical protein [Clostridia bacterium]
MQNDALYDLTSGWRSDSYRFLASETFADPNGVQVRCDAWGDDYLWLPSVTEAGFEDQLKDNNIWRLPNSQRISSTAVALTAYRTGDWDTYRNTLCIKPTGGYNSVTVDNTFGVRPAIHLNLTATGLFTQLDNPTDVTTTYNYSTQNVKSVYDAKPSDVTWYAPSFYEPADTNVKLSYFDNNGAAVSTMKDAGTYWVKADITAYVDAVNAKIDSDGASWGATQIAAAKAYMKPAFDGTADTSDSAHIESDTVRWFRFIIKPKEVTVNKPAYNSSTNVFTAPTFANASGELYADAPALATRFSGTAADGTVFDQINTLPNKRGNFTAQAVLVKSTTDTTLYDGGNYVIKDETNIKCDVVITYLKLTILNLANTTQTYTGSDIKFPLPAAYNATWRDVADFVLPTGVTVQGDDTNGWSLVAKTAGEYTITAKIKSDKNSDWCWAGPNNTEIQTDQTIKITVARKTLFVDFTSSSGAFVLQKNAAVMFGVEPSNAVDGDDVQVSLKYYNKEHPESPILVPGGKLNAAALEQGTYVLEAVLDDDLAAENCNYVLDTTANTQEFTVSSQGINIPTIEWQYRENNGTATAISGSGESATNPYVVTYTGKTFVFSITVNAATLANSGVKIDATYGTNGYTNSSQTNATENAVAVTVRFVPYSAEYAFIDTNGQQAAQQYEDYTLYVKVDKATIDFSKIEWSADELEFTGINQTISVVGGLPSFITPTCLGTTQSAIGDYVASISRLTV